MGGSASRGSERINRIFSEKIFSESDRSKTGWRFGLPTFSENRQIEPSYFESLHTHCTTKAQVLSIVY